MNRLLILAVGIILAQLQVNAFVHYLVAGQHLMRWNIETGGVHTNVFNPTTKKIRYFISNQTYSTTNRLAEQNAIRAAFDQWEAVTGSKLQFEEGGIIGTNVDVIWDNTNIVFWTKNLIVGGTENLSGRRAWTSVIYSIDTGRILEADMVLNGLQFPWFTDFSNSTNQALFVESVVGHEIGHFVGLDHSPAGGATVTASAPAGIASEAGLSADEIAAARYIYPDPRLKWATIKGRVTVNNSPVLGAVVVAEDADGNIAGATLSRMTGDYEIYGLAAGTYNFRVSPLDPLETTKVNSLLKGEEIAIDYWNAFTSFHATTNLAITLTNGQVRVQNVTPYAGNPAFRISSISKPTQVAGLVSLNRFAASLPAGASNYIVGVSGQNLKTNSTLRVTGDGITHGATTFISNKFPGIHSLTVPISVSSNATPGLRTFVVQNGTNFAYANGYLDLTGPVIDFNFDGVDDRFQRQYWKRWTSAEAGPTANPDQDYFSNDFEYRTGSNPTNKTSFSFLIDTVSFLPFGNRVSWDADIGKKYQVYSRATFGDTLTWEKVGGPVTATNKVMSVVEPRPPTGRPEKKFYRLELVP